MASIANWDSHYQRVTVSFCPPMYVFFLGGEELGIMGWSNGIPYNTSTVTVTFSGGEVDIMGWANGLCPQFTAFWNMNDWILGYSAHLQMIYLPIESGDCSYCFISMLNYQRVDRPWRGLEFAWVEFGDTHTDISYFCAASHSQQNKRCFGFRVWNPCWKQHKWILGC